MGKALRGRRDEVVLSTKALPVHKDRPLKPKRLRRSVEKSLKRLRTDHVDLFFVHGMKVRDLHHTREVLVPELLALKDDGLIRHLAASEAFASDNGHDSLGQSLDAGDDWYDVLMVGHNPFNPSARDRVFPATEERNIGVLVMFAVRKSLASAEGVRRVDRRARGARGARRGGLSMPTIRSGSCSPMVGRPPSPRPPTASPVTSPAATWS